MSTDDGESSGFWDTISENILAARDVGVAAITTAQTIGQLLGASATPASNTGTLPPQAGSYQQQAVPGNFLKDNAKWILLGLGVLVLILAFKKK